MPLHIIHPLDRAVIENLFGDLLGMHAQIKGLVSCSAIPEMLVCNVWKIEQIYLHVGHQNSSFDHIVERAVGGAGISY